MSDQPIPDAKLEGDVRRLTALALLAAGACYAFDEGDRELLGDLQEAAAAVRDQLGEPRRKPV